MKMNKNIDVFGIGARLNGSLKSVLRQEDIDYVKSLPEDMQEDAIRRIAKKRLDDMDRRCEESTRKWRKEYRSDYSHAESSSSFHSSTYTRIEEAYYEYSSSNEWN